MGVFVGQGFHNFRIFSLHPEVARTFFHASNMLSLPSFTLLFAGIRKEHLPEAHEEQKL